MKCAEKVPYASELLAQNAAWLHRAAYPECGGVDVYRCACSDWHIGHPTRSVAAACDAAKARPRLWRPGRWTGGRRHPSARDRQRAG